MSGHILLFFIVLLLFYKHWKSVFWWKEKFYTLEKEISLPSIWFHKCAVSLTHFLFQARTYRCQTSNCSCHQQLQEICDYCHCSLHLTQCKFYVALLQIGLREQNERSNWFKSFRMLTFFGVQNHVKGITKCF